MMEKLRIGKWASDLATPQEVADWRAEARAMVKKYGWEDRFVYPYSRPEPVLDIINYGCDSDGYDGYERCTHGSKQYVLSMLNGLVSTLNAWEKNRINTQLHGVKLRNTTNGDIIAAVPEVAECLVETGYFERV